MSVEGCGRFGKIFLIVINILFFLLGIGLMVAGIVLKLNQSEDVFPALSILQENATTLEQKMNGISLLAIIIGVLVACVSGFGLFGALCEVKYILVAYAVLVIILLAMEIAAVVLGFMLRDKIEEKIKENMLKLLEKNYVNDSVNSSNSVSNEWNLLFLKFNCCAVNPVVGTKNDFDQTPWCTTEGECHDVNAQIPKTCCVGVNASNFEQKASQECYVYVTGDFKTTGCFNRIKELIKTHSAAVIGISLAIMIIEILGIVFAFILFRRLGLQNVVI